jgi:hypothetical protein
MAVATRAGTRPELGRTYLDYARMLLARGKRCDRQHAVALVTQASMIFAELAMEPYIQDAAQLAQTLQQPPFHGVLAERLSAQEANTLLGLARVRTNFLR